MDQARRGSAPAALRSAQYGDASTISRVDQNFHRELPVILRRRIRRLRYATM